MPQPAPAALAARRGSELEADNEGLNSAELTPSSSSVNKNLLDQAIERIRPMLADASLPTKRRIRLLWAACKMATDLAASDVVESVFNELAIETGIIDGAGRYTSSDIAEDRIRHGAEDVARVIRWAMRGMNPFESGPLT
jgi:hypothetical protein